jgi:quercetin dioxygenase-like cupin family protein
VAELNGQHVKLVKFRGEFVWHHHEHEDEMFLVHRGRFVMEFQGSARGGRERGSSLWLCRGAWSIGRSRPTRSHVVLFEPATTLNTGNVESERTVRDLKWA